MTLRDVSSEGFVQGRHARANYGDGVLELKADVAIIGSGAGGSAAAAALAESGLTVIVLEEGQHWAPGDFKAQTPFAFRNLYQGRGARSMRGNAVIPLPGGRGVGGSTLINSAICFRCPPEVLREWRDDHGCETVSDARFSAYFDRIWSTIGVSVNPVDVQGNNNLIFKKGSEALGLEGAFLARSAPGCVGCGVCQYGCPTGGKLSVDRTFLAEALATERVGVYADCRMRGVETKGDKVLAITGDVMDPLAQTPVGRVRVVADQFIVSGGPIGTPLFLLGNGLADNTHCGQHLVVHPTVAALARFPQEITPWKGVTQGYYVDMWKEGYLLQTYTTTPDQTALVLQTTIGEESQAVMKDLRYLASAGVLVHDQDSHGFVRHTPIGPDLYYHLGDGDRERILRGLRKAAEVFFAAGAVEVFPGRVGTARIKSAASIDAELPLDVPASGLMLYASHPMGTARMGASADRAVVDPRGRVFGWANLHVADASVFPTSLGVNPQVTTMAMGLLVGHAIAGRV